MAALSAITACAAHAQDLGPTTSARVSDYRPVFQECRQADGPPRLAIRHMEIGGTGMLLTVDPATLATRLERDQDWSCTDTDDDAERDTRLVRAVRTSFAARAAGPARQPAVIADGGIVRGSPAGSFITGDLCPSRKPLDRIFLERLQAIEPRVPVALSISGVWLIRHGADFQWLRDRERAGALAITWVDHSYHHPYVPGRPLSDNFLLMAGIDMQAEILETEKLLIAGGETPSVFFRFPGLISNTALMRVVRDDHLVVLGADAWLAISQQPTPGSVILVHPNGNEPSGLSIFSTLLASGALPRPFRPIDEAP